MKIKLLFCLISGAFLLMNCRSEESTEIAEKKMLLSKITTVYYDNPTNPETTISTLNYNDKGELVKNNSEAGNAVFEYDADGKPSKVLYYNNNNTLTYTSVYTYNGEKLTSIKSVYDNPNFNREHAFTYNSLGKVISSKLCQSENCNNPTRNTYTYIEDNISIATNERGTITRWDYLYDDNLNPFHYTNPYLKIMMGGAYAMSKNNYLSESISYKDSDGNWTQNQYITYTFQYNSEKLPTQVVGKDINGNNYVKYEYEYILK